MESTTKVQTSICYPLAASLTQKTAETRAKGPITMQKWEYAYINSGRTRASLVYLRPNGEKKEEIIHQKKDEDIWLLVEPWIARLGQEGYEMTGVTVAQTFEFWFKRPL